MSKNQAAHLEQPEKILIGINRSASADELRTGAGAGDGCVTDLGKTNSDRNSNCLKVHSDESKTDVYTCVSRNAFNCRRGIELSPDLCRPGATRVGMWHNADLGKVILLKALVLDDQRAVEMLAALRGEVYSLFVKNGLYSREDSLGSFRRGILAYSSAGNLGGRAADDEDIALLKIRLGKKIGKNDFRLVLDFVEKFAHFN